MDTHCPYVIDLYLPRAADMYTRLNPPAEDLANAIGVWSLFTVQHNLIGHVTNHKIVDFGPGRNVTVDASYIVGSRLREVGGGMMGEVRFVNLRIGYKIRLVDRRPGNN